jgi:hypothetical protein
LYAAHLPDPARGERLLAASAAGTLDFAAPEQRNVAGVPGKEVQTYPCKSVSSVQSVL